MWVHWPVDGWGRTGTILRRAGPAINSAPRRRQQMLSASIINEEPIPLHNNTIPYYCGCLLKLSAFRMHEIVAGISRLCTTSTTFLHFHPMTSLHNGARSIQPPVSISEKDLDELHYQAEVIRFYAMGEIGEFHYI